MGIGTVLRHGLRDAAKRRVNVFVKGVTDEKICGDPEDNKRQGEKARVP
jgi:hypothetical protein